MMEKNKCRVNRIKLLFTIVDRGLGDEVVESYRESGVTFNMVSPGYGAAGSDIMDCLGLTDSERDIILSVVTEEKVTGVMNKIQYKYDLDEQGNGIIFALPITGVSGPLALRYISGIPGEEKKEERKSMSVEREYDLIITIVNRGFADQVVDAAREAGAHGGTVFYARGTGVHEIEKFFAISIQPEKEVILNLVKHRETQPIMRAIIDAAGLATEGKGFSISLPVTDVAGVINYFEELEKVEKP